MIYVLGSFDGFHRGHQLLFQKARELAKVRKCSWGVLTFAPDPKVFLGKRPKKNLFLPQERYKIANWLGVPVIETLPFTTELSAMKPEQFFAFMEQRYTLEGFVAGENFRFGQGREGTVATLERYCVSNNKMFAHVPLAEFEGDFVSASRIRSCVAKGKVEKTLELLGYPYFMSGIVVEGNKRGRTLGFPTANLSVKEEKLLPSNGVYAGLVSVEGIPYISAINVGRNPTFKGIEGTRIEAHLQNFQGDLYGEHLAYHLLQRIREEKKFPSVDSLVKQLQQDHNVIGHAVRTWLERNQKERLTEWIRL